jgi:small conductance mechanosensitive channel
MEKFDFNLLEALQQWSIVHVPKLIIILFGMWLTIKVAGFIGKRIRAHVEDDDPTRQSEREKRAETLVTISNTIVKIVVIAFGVLMIVKELGIDIGPLLAGAGIMGLAIGLVHKRWLRMSSPAFLSLWKTSSGSAMSSRPVITPV